MSERLLPRLEQKLETGIERRAADRIVERLAAAPEAVAPPEVAPPLASKPARESADPTSFKRRHLGGVGTVAIAAARGRYEPPPPDPEADGGAAPKAAPPA